MFIGDYYYEFPTSLPTLNVTTVYFVIFAFIVFCLCVPFKYKLRPFILIIADCLFLYSFSLYHLIAVLIIALIAYLFGLLFLKFKKKIILVLTIIPFVLVMAYFKYGNLLTNTTSLIAPLGLSFYTFKIISYLVDAYQGKILPEKNPLYFFNYVLFFPCLMAGPINRYKGFSEVIKKPQEFDYREAKDGGIQMLLGIFEKMVFCDFIGHVVGLGLGNTEIVGKYTLLSVVLYSFQIYLDFDAYSNIAIGCARMLGFKLPKNFNSPYVASTLKGFWRRWHISLSTWLRDYIYIPLGGSRKGTIRKYINLIIVFLISGLWHGSTINFVIWGLAHAIIQIIEDLILTPFKKMNIPKAVKVIAYPFGVIINFCIVTALWLVFRYSTMNEVFDVVNRIGTSFTTTTTAIELTRNEWIWLGVVLVIVIVTDILRSRFDMMKVLGNSFFLIRWLFYAVVIVVFLIFAVYGGSYDPADFIYVIF